MAGAELVRVRVRVRRRFAQPTAKRSATGLAMISGACPVSPSRIRAIGTHGKPGVVQMERHCLCLNGVPQGQQPSAWAGLGHVDCTVWETRCMEIGPGRLGGAPLPCNKRFCSRAVERLLVHGGDTYVLCARVWGGESVSVQPSCF